MGERNFLVEGVSGSGKSAVYDELRRRGLHAINGDQELAYQGHPSTGDPVDGITGADVHHHHLWRVEQVRTLSADRSTSVTFFCGGSRNHGNFIDVFDIVFVLEADLDTVLRRIDQRSTDEWGGRPDERALIERLHRSQAEIPPGGVPIDATRPVVQVVDDILARAGMTL